MSLALLTTYGSEDEDEDSPSASSPVVERETSQSRLCLPPPRRTSSSTTREKRVVSFQPPLNESSLREDVQRPQRKRQADDTVPGPTPAPSGLSALLPAPKHSSKAPRSSPSASFVPVASESDTGGVSNIRARAIRDAPLRPVRMRPGARAGAVRNDKDDDKDEEEEKEEEEEEERDTALPPSLVPRDGVEFIPKRELRKDFPDEDAQPKFIEVEAEKLHKSTDTRAPIIPLHDNPAEPTRQAPTYVQRRKHHITQLAFDAQRRAAELEQKHSTSLVTKRQTWAKYGWS